MIVLSIAIVVVIVAYVIERGRHEQTRLRSLEKDALIFAFQQQICAGDTVKLPDGQTGRVWESTPDTVLVETESLDIYSVSRWKLRPLEEC